MQKCESEVKIVSHLVKMHLDLPWKPTRNCEFWAAFLREVSEFELWGESGSRFHSLGAEAWNAWDPLTVLRRGSAKGPVLGDRRQQGGMQGISSAWEWIGVMVPESCLGLMPSHWNRTMHTGARDTLQVLVHQTDRCVTEQHGAEYHPRTFGQFHTLLNWWTDQFRC